MAYSEPGVRGEGDVRARALDRRREVRFKRGKEKVNSPSKATNGTEQMMVREETAHT